MRRAFKTRLKVNDRTATILSQWCGCARLAYNTCLAQWNDMYRQGLKPNYYAVKKWFNSIKRERFPFIMDVSKWAVEAAVKDLSDAFGRLFRKQNRHPKFHKKGAHDSFRIDGSVVRVEGNKVCLPKKLTLTMHERFRYEHIATKIYNVTVSHRAGYWFISITCEIPDMVRENQAKRAVGIDLGVKELATCSDGTVIANPKTLRKRERRKKHLQRALARKQHGSKNRQKARNKLARYEYHTACKRYDWLHKHTTRIANENSVVFMEDLNVRGMLANHSLAKSISDASFGEITRQLSYKTTVRKIDRYYPSSKKCSQCGAVQDMPLSARTYECPSCGLVMDRDMNAAVNILHVGMANYPELMPVEDDNHQTGQPVLAPREAGIKTSTRQGLNKF